MVLLGGLLVAAFAGLIVWLCAYAWGGRASGWPDQRAPSRWRYVLYAAATVGGVVAILRIRALPAMLLFGVAAWIVIGARGGRLRRCHNCGDPLAVGTDTCGNCGTSIR